MMKFDNTTTSMLVDSGAQSPMLGKKQLDNLAKDGLKAKLRPEERNFRLKRMGIYRLWVNLRRVSSVMEGKLWKLSL